MTKQPFQPAQLSKRQQQILACIEEHLDRHGYPPAVRDIGKAVGLRSPASVHAQLAKLQQLGKLQRNLGTSRSIVLRNTASKQAVKLPLLGRVAAGEPLLAQEHVEGFMLVPTLAGSERGSFLLRVQGESMVGAGILDGDYVVVHHQEIADSGQIVVALIDDEATVKRFHIKKNIITLESENPAYPPMQVDNLRILGVVVGVMRSIQQ